TCSRVANIPPNPTATEETRNLSRTGGFAWRAVGVAAHKPTSRARTTLPINPAVAITRPELSYRISDPPARANAPTATPAAPALSRTVQRARLSGDESAIAPPIINQRVPFTRIAAEHLANEDHMVAGGHGLRHPAIHPGERRLEHGSARILG